MKIPTDVFEFKLEEQPSEIEANRFCSKYTFTQNGAQGTNINSKETGDEPTVDMEAADGDFNGKSARSSLDAEDCSDERMLRLGGIPTITSTKQRRYPDREPNNCIDGSFLEGSSYTATAFQEIFYGSPSKMEYVQDESVGTDSDVDESRSDESASYSSATPDNHDILDGPLSNHQFDQWGMFENKPIVFCPDYLYYRGTSYAVTDTTVTFSSNCVEVKGSTLNGNSETSCIRFGVEDIFQIQSHLSGRFDVAVFKIHVNKRSTTQGENAHESSGIEEVEFAVNDFDLSEKCEAIQSLDGYKTVWNYNEIEEWRENSHRETSDQQSKKYFPSYGEPLEEVYYPKGDPDAVCISKRDFDLLAPETFVNDTIIDFYIQYLKNGIPPEKRQRYHFFNCFFFRKLADMDKDPTSAFDGRAAFLRVRKWTRKVDLFDKDFVFIPVNYNYHWSLIVICHPGEVANFTDDDTAVSSVKVPCILHMDSFRGSHVGLKDLLQSYLWEEWKERTKETSEVVSSKFRNLRFLSLEVQPEVSLPIPINYLHSHTKLVSYEEFECSKHNSYGRFISIVSVRGESRAVIILPEIELHAGWGEKASKIERFIHRNFPFTRETELPKLHHAFAHTLRSNKWSESIANIKVIQPEDGPIKIVGSMPTVKSLLNICIVGKFSKELDIIPSRTEVRRWVNNKWSDAVGVYELNGLLFLFEFPTRRMAEQTMEETWRWKNATLLLRWWSLAAACYPFETKFDWIWVRILGLPLHL
ncbi:PREDICTED: probable ubiquitin-like-specific protease 2B [Nicotiana attenuata]|uniref:probable ubiquitin-like-specific protease 2B n=1 Tax=Nicotiana attenuata TaxID=49451 RepID=UPI000904A4C9|nr:PREDICTED: probable ubiquitin-like-specific protease 2B [Nicotiana attenuata]